MWQTLIQPSKQGLKDLNPTIQTGTERP